MATIIFYFVITPIAIAYCVWLAVDTVRVCREIDKQRTKRSSRTARLLSISGAMEVR